VTIDDVAQYRVMRATARLAHRTTRPGPEVTTTASRLALSGSCSANSGEGRSDGTDDEVIRPLSTTLGWDQAADPDRARSPLVAVSGTDDDPGWMPLVPIAMAMFIIALDTTMLNVAIPDIVADPGHGHIGGAVRGGADLRDVATGQRTGAHSLDQHPNVAKVGVASSNSAADRNRPHL